MTSLRFHARTLSYCFGLAFIVTSANAQIDTTNLTYDFDANTDRDLTDGWDSILNSGQRPFNFSNTTRVLGGNEGPQTNATLGAIHGIGGYLDFRRQNTSAINADDNASANSYGGNFPTNPSSADASFEFWLRVDNNSVNQVIWESGGGTDGSSFTISSAGNLQWVVKDGDASDFVSVPITTGEYHHVVGVYDRDGGAGDEDTLTLYLNGVATSGTNTETVLHDWAGGDATALGGRVSAVGADTGPIASLGTYTNLDGRISAFRFYETALTASDVANSIEVAQQSNVYFDDGFGSIGTDNLWINGANWDGNVVPSLNQNVFVNAGQTVRLEDGNASAQTLTVGSSGTSELTSYTTDGTDPALGNGAVVMNGGTLQVAQLLVGSDGTTGSFTINDGWLDIDYATPVDAADAIHAVALGYSTSSGDPATDVNVFNMNGGRVTVDGRRFEIGKTEVNNARTNATFNMNGGDFDTTQNIILGQGGIANNSLVTLNITGGDIRTTADFNVNDGTSTFTMSDGFFSVRDFQTQNTAGNTGTVNLTGGTFEIRDDMNNRSGNTTLTLAGGTIDFDAANPGSGLREVQDLVFSSGTMRFSIDDATNGPIPLTVGQQSGSGIFTGTGEVAIEFDNTPSAQITTTTTWSGASGDWTPTNTTEWSDDNPIQYIGTGTAYDVIVPAGTTTMTDLGNLASADPSTWTVQTATTNSADDTLQVVAARDIAMTPINAVIDSTGNTVTRSSLLNVSEQVGADAANLTVENGTLDLQSNDLQIGGSAVGTVTLNGGQFLNVGNVLFGNGGPRGGTLQLNGGSLVVTGHIVEGQLGAPDAAGVGEAQLHIDGGSLTVQGSIDVQRFAIGQTASTTGEYTTFNQWQDITASGTTSIGANGTGTLNFGGRTFAAGNELLLGETATGNGTINQTNGTVTVANGLIIGDNGTGTYNLLNGTVDVNAAGLRLADEVSSSGSLTVGALDGSTSGEIFVNGGNFETADVGAGTFNLYSGTVHQESNNWITGQADGSAATVQIGGGSGVATYGGASSSTGWDWNTNGGFGDVEVLQNGVVDVARSLNLGSTADPNSGLELDISGGAVNVGVAQAADLNYRGNGPRDHIRLLSGRLTVSRNINIDDGTGQFTVQGSGNTLTGGSTMTVATGNQLNFNLDALGVTPFDIQAEATIAGTINIDESAIAANAANAATTLGTIGAWDGTDTNWDKRNPNGSTGFQTNDRVVLVQTADVNTATTPIDASSVTLNQTGTNWALDTSVPTELALVAQNSIATGASHAILDSDGTTTRASNLTVSTTAGTPDAAGLTVTSGDTLDLGGNTMTVTDATLAGEGLITNGSTVLGSGAVVNPGATLNGLVSGGSMIGELTFNGNVDAQSGSILNFTAVTPTTSPDGGTATAVHDVIGGTGTLTLNPGSSIVMNWGGAPELIRLDEFDLLNFAGITDNGFDLGTTGGSDFRNGGTLGDLTLPELLGFDSTWVWDVSNFFSTGTVIIVPEPSRALLMIFGLGTLLLRRRR